MATVNTVAAPGSIFYSPVDDSSTARLTHVGATSGGLPTGTDYVDSLVTLAYNLEADKNFRRALLFDRFSTVRPTKLSHNGAVIQLNIIDDIDDDPATALIPEDYDVLPTPLVSYKTQAILKEYGRAVTTTALLRGTSMVPIDPVAAERIGRNMGATMDRLSLATLLAAGGVTKAGAAGSAPTAVTVAGSPSGTVRAAFQSFVSNDVKGFNDGGFAAVMSPANATALKAEADAAGFRFWQVNQQPAGGTGNIAAGMADRPMSYFGSYEGFDMYVSNTPGLSAVGCVFVGGDALAKVFSSAPGFGSGPQVVISPVVDRLRRFVSVGWYWLGAYARYRAEAVLTGDLSA